MQPPLQEYLKGTNFRGYKFSPNKFLRFLNLSAKLSSAKYTNYIARPRKLVPRYLNIFEPRKISSPKFTNWRFSYCRYKLFFKYVLILVLKNAYSFNFLFISGKNSYSKYANRENKFPRNLHILTYLTAKICSAHPRKFVPVRYNILLMPYNVFTS